MLLSVEDIGATLASFSRFPLRSSSLSSSDQFLAQEYLKELEMKYREFRYTLDAMEEKVLGDLSDKLWLNWVSLLSSNRAFYDRKSIKDIPASPASMGKSTLALSSSHRLMKNEENGEVRDLSAMLRQKHWLRDFRGVSHHAQDIFDELRYKLLRLQVESRGSSENTLCIEHEEESHQKVRELMINSCFSSSIRSRVHDMNRKYREIFQDANGLTRERLIYTEETTHLPSDQFCLGREGDLGLIIDYLLDHDSVGSNLRVLPIVGMRGVGKTALAQHLFRHPVVSAHFELRVWVYIGKYSGPQDLMRKIIESVPKNPCLLDEPSALLNKVAQELRGKRFLLVLDDVCTEDPDLWGNLRHSLNSGAEGSTVLVTTDSFTVAEIMGTVEFPYYLGCLSTSDGWSLFKKYAFDDREVDELRARVDILQKIVEKCQGLPLAVKELALQLQLRYFRDEVMLDDSLQNSIQYLDTEGNILDFRMHHISVHLMRCVAYCSLFPKGYPFTRDRLVRLWTAQGFIQSEEGKQVEDTGIEYFEKLSLCSLIRPSQKEEGAYELHNIDHDLLAESILGSECFGKEQDDICCFPYQAHHSSFVPHVVEATVQFQSSKHSTLRSFLIIRTSPKHVPSTIPSFENLENLFQSFSCLRALDLSFTGIYELPDSIGNLRHLRYLVLNGTHIKGLPESVCRLYLLQTLELKECLKLRGLPKDMKNLINLRHLILDSQASFCLPAGIENLTSLQTLSRFNVGRDSGYCGIQGLKALGNLSGELHISGLCDVISVEDAMDALKHKPYLDKLTLTWPNDEVAESLHFHMDDSVLAAKSAKEEKILENLQPHANLTQLIIQSYSGVRFPEWVGDSSFSKLEFVSLENCNMCKILPPLGQLQSLKFLNIISMAGGMRVALVGNEFCSSTNPYSMSFPSLETLCLIGMTEWEEWVEPMEVDFPRLRKLTIRNCPRLRGIPNLLSSLEELEVVNCLELATLPIRLRYLRKLLIKDCPKLKRETGLLSSLTALQELEMNCADLVTFPTLPFLRHLQLCARNELTDLPALPLLETLELRASKRLITFSSMPSLCNLDLWACRGLTALPHLPCLRGLNVMYCEELASLPTFPNLEHLTVGYCSALTSISPLPSLEELSIEDCERLKSIDFSSSTSLINLLIGNCPRLEFSPDEKFPNTLNYLQIDGCPSISDWCRRYGDSKLGHVLNVFLDGRWAD